MALFDDLIFDDLIFDTVEVVMVDTADLAVPGFYGIATFSATYGIASFPGEYGLDQVPGRWRVA